MECFKHSFMGHTSRSMEDSSAEDNLNCGDQEVSEEKNVSVWPKDWSCDILVRTWLLFALV